MLQPRCKKTNNIYTDPGLVEFVMNYVALFLLLFADLIRVVLWENDKHIIVENESIENF